MSINKLVTIFCLDFKELRHYNLKSFLSKVILLNLI